MAESSADLLRTSGSICRQQVNVAMGQKEAMKKAPSSAPWQNPTGFAATFPDKLWQLLC